VSPPSPAERVRQTVRLLGDEGSAGVARRLLDRARELLPPPTRRRGLVDREDLLRVAEIAAAGWPPAERLAHGGHGPMTVAWVCFAPSPGSGGHTTMFRMVAALEAAGHRCIVYLRDDHGWSLEQHRRTIRRCWPAVRADIRDLASGIDDAHAIFATSWQTAYSVLASPAKGARLYFVQDFEPDFYASGSEALLAESTFQFGFHPITAGSWLAQFLRRKYGIAADHFDFGCDLEHYRLDAAAAATGERSPAVCYYSRPSTPRRAHELGMMALDIFAERHPDVEIHLFGEPARDYPLVHVSHGVLSPAELNGLYNRCAAGLVLSATNVSLVPYEMLAAGCIPVVNDAEHNRQVLDNEEVTYARATPFELAAALTTIIERTPEARAIGARRASQSVQGRSWKVSGDVVERTIGRIVAGGAAPYTHPAGTQRV